MLRLSDTKSCEPYTIHSTRVYQCHYIVRYNWENIAGQYHLAKRLASKACLVHKEVFKLSNVVLPKSLNRYNWAMGLLLLVEVLY